MKENTNENKINKINVIKNIKKVDILKAFVLIIIIIYIGYAFSKLIRSPSKTFMIEQGSLSLEENVTGYIIRDETVIEGQNSTDELKAVKKENERVSKGEVVFTYVNKSEEQLEEKINQIEQEISTIMENQTSIPNNDTKVLDSQIEISLEEVTNINDVKKLIEYKNTINNYIEKKAKISGELSKSGSKIKELMNQKESYENQLNQVKESVKATAAGIVSYRIDGFENVLTPKTFSNLNTQVLESLNIETGQVSESKNKAKVVDNFCCYLAANMKSDAALNSQVEDKVILRINNSLEVEANIEYIVEETDGSRLIIFRFTKNTQELIQYRKVNFEVIWWRESGLKVPNEAISNRKEFVISNDDEKEEKIIIGEITRVRTGYQETVVVEILKENQNYSLIGSLSTKQITDIDGLEVDITNLKTISLYDEVLAKTK